MVLFDLFGVEKPVIGMVHAPPLPGAPRNELRMQAIIEWVLRDAEALAEGGVDGLLLENFGDVPFFPGPVPPDTVAFMTRLATEIKQRVALPLGVNVLRNDSSSALAVAAASGAAFIRVNIHTGARVTDQGVMQGAAHETVRRRKLLGCDVKIFADVDVKHSAPLAARPLAEEVEELISRGCADAVIVTGYATGSEPSIEHVRIVKDAAHGAAVIAGSGVDPSNATAILRIADGVIAGTALKQDGITTNPVDRARVRAFMQAARAAG